MGTYEPKQFAALLLTLALAACGGGGGDDGDEEELPFPAFLLNFGNIGSNSDFWTSTGCEGRNLRIAFGSSGPGFSGSSGGCAMRDDRGCNEVPRNFESADCTWRTNGVGLVLISHEQADFNNVTCLRSIAEIQRGDSNDVFFGRPSYGFGHLTASACEFRRTSSGTL